MRWRSVTMGTVAALAAAVLVGGGVPALAAPAPATTQVQTAAAATPVAASAPAPTYTNPVSSGVVDTFPDPAMIRGKDGAWYAYGTRTPSSRARASRASGCCRSCGPRTWSNVGVRSATSSPAESPAAYWAAGTRAVGARHPLHRRQLPPRRTRSRTAASRCSPRRTPDRARGPTAGPSSARAGSRLSHRQHRPGACSPTPTARTTSTGAATTSSASRR